MDELQVKESDWELLLERAEGLISGDPFSARGWAHHVADEIDAWRHTHADPRGSLAMLAQRTERLIECTEQATQDLQEESAERQRHWRQREMRAAQPAARAHS